ncbi:MAG: nucleotide sugar dehydrogenase [Bacillota bacterium]
MELREKIERKAAVVAVIGLGYVGLPMALAFSRKGFRVIGIDRDREKISLLEQGRSYIRGISELDLSLFVQQGLLAVTWRYEALEEVDVIVLCLPTPLDKSGEPDLSMLQSALEEVARHLRPGQLVVLESTSFPGTTEEIAYPLLVSRGYQVGKDFYLVYSPERIDPGNPAYSVETIPKLVAGMTTDCAEIATVFYSQVVSNVIQVTSPKVAEMAKLIENTFRSVNIALINELAMVAHILEIDIWEAVEVASTKPFGFMPFFPGPGVGGHCLPVDPVYLVWRAERANIRPQLIELASRINREVPLYIVDRIAETLKLHNCTLPGAKILVLGVTYKRDIEDLRESPALEIIRLLMEREARVVYNDPFVPQLKIMDQPIPCSPLTEEAVSGQDCLVIVTDHACYDYVWLVQHAKMIFDTRNATSRDAAKSANVFKL